MSSWAQLQKNFDKRLEHDEIDDFLDNLNASINLRIKELEDEGKNLLPDQFENPQDIEAYRDYLCERTSSLFATKILGDELSVVALYKKVETHTVRIIKRMLSTSSTRNLSYFKNICDVLPFEITTVNGFAGFNELRLLNNSIKHQGKVSSELANEFSEWEQGSELSNLDKVFQRLLPEVKLYVSDLAEKLHMYTS